MKVLRFEYNGQILGSIKVGVFFIEKKEGFPTLRLDS
jgi:hypothetical protein